MGKVRLPNDDGRTVKLEFPLTCDAITCIVFANGQFSDVLGAACGLGVTQYRILAALERGDSLPCAKLAALLELTSGTVSQASSKLARKGFLTKQGGRRACEIAPPGLRALRTGDDALAESLRSMFGMLSDETRRLIRVGSAITNQTHGPVRIHDGEFDTDYAVFETYLADGRLFTECAHEGGLSLTEFRALYELLDAGPMSCGNLALRLLLSKQATSDAIAGLERKRLMAKREIEGDRRSKRVSLTDNGRKTAETMAVRMDAESCKRIRSWNPEETRAYAELSTKFVEYHWRERRA